MTLLAAAMGWLLACSAFAFALPVLPLLPLTTTLAALLPSRTARLRAAHIAVAAVVTLAAALLLHRAQPPANGIAAHADESVALLGRALADGDRHPTYTTITVAAKQVTIGGATATTSGRVLVYLPAVPDAPGGEIHAGDVLRLTGRLEAPATAARDDGYAAYLERQGIAGVLAYPRTAFVRRPAENPFHAALRGLRDRMQHGLSTLLPPREAALASAAMFGNRHALPRDLAADLLTTGTTHVATFSAFNVLLLYGAAIALLAPLLGRRRATWLALLAAFAYGALAGTGVAGMRGEAIATVLTLATLSGRPYSAAAALLLVAAALTVADPTLPADAGFQLTFAAAAGVAVVAPWLRSLFGDDEGGGRGLRGAFALSAGVSLAVAPAAAAAGGTSLISPLANALLYPLLVPLTVLSALTAALAALWSPLAWPVAAPLFLLMRGVAVFVHALATAPGATVAWQGNGAVSTVTWYGTIALIGAVGSRLGRWLARLRPALPQQPQRRRLPLPAPVAAFGALALFVSASPVYATFAARQPPATAVRWLDTGARPTALITGRNGLRVLVCSATEPAALAQAIEAATDDGGGVDVLVADAGSAGAALQTARALHAAELIQPGNADTAASDPKRGPQIVALHGRATLDLGGGDTATVTAFDRGETVEIDADSHRLLLVEDSRALSQLASSLSGAPYDLVALPPLAGSRLYDALGALHGGALLLAGRWSDADATIARATWSGGRVVAGADALSVVRGGALTISADR